MNPENDLIISQRLAKNFRRNLVERLIEFGLLCSGLVAIFITLAIVYVLVSEAIPFLKLLIPLATSPIKLEIFPLPNKRTTKITTIAICQIPILI